MSKNVRHSKENANWESPPSSINCARTALGGRINLDPWSCAGANARVGADEYFGPDHIVQSLRDGFTIPWRVDGLPVESVFGNHPGLTTQESWRKVCEEFLAENFRRMVWEGFSVEQLALLSEPDSRRLVERFELGIYYPTDFSIAYLRKRVHYIDAKNPDRPSRPGHANYVLGVNTDPRLFEEAYAPLGQITHGTFTRLAFPEHAY